MNGIWHMEATSKELPAANTGQCVCCQGHLLMMLMGCLMQQLMMPSSPYSSAQAAHACLLTPAPTTSLRIAASSGSMREAMPCVRTHMKKRR